MTRLLAILLLLPAIASAAGLGVYNPAQHAVNGFMPTQLPGLQLWLDASRIGFTNGANVPVWLDYSGNAFDATNSTSSKQPTVSRLSGRPSVKFDGTDDLLELIRGTNITSAKDQLSFFLAIEKTTGINSEQALMYVPQTDRSAGNLNVISLTAVNQIRTGGRRLVTDSFQGATNAITSASVIACIFTYTNANLDIRISGKSTNRTFQTSGPSGTNANGIISIGAWAHFSQDYYNGLLSEIILFGKSITTEQRLQVERYLGTKYGIVVQ